MPKTPIGTVKGRTPANHKSGVCLSWSCREQRTAGDYCPGHADNLERTGFLNPCQAEGCDRMAERVSAPGVGPTYCASHGHQVYRREPVRQLGPAHLRGDVYTRFFAQVRGDFETGCWVWTGEADMRPGNHYGYFSVDGGQRKARAHRWAWANVAGLELVPGMHVDHVCENTLCVRPGHLQQVPPGTNTRLVKARRETPVPAGHEVVPPNRHQTEREYWMGLAHGLPVAMLGQDEILLEPFHDPAGNGPQQMVEVSIKTF